MGQLTYAAFMKIWSSPLHRALCGVAVAWALLAASTSHAVWSEYAMVSSTMGVSDSRICIGESSRGDIGCPSYAPYVSSAGLLGIGTTAPSTTLTVSGTTYTHILQLEEKGGAAPPTGYQGGYWLTSGTAVYYNGGNVGIGTANPTASLQVVGNINIGPNVGSYVTFGPPTSTSTTLVLQGASASGDGGNIELSSNNNNYYDAELHTFRDVSGGTTLGYINSSGDYIATNSVVVGTGDLYLSRTSSVNGYITRPNVNGYKNLVFAVTGGSALENVTANTGSFNVTSAAYKPGGGTWSDSSDKRLKTNIQPITDALEKLMLLQGVNFDWKKPEMHDNDHHAGGFIAQDVEKVFPEFIRKKACEKEECELVDNGEIRTLNFPFKFNAYVVEAIKEQQSHIKSLQSANDNLSTEIKALRAELEAMKRAGVH